jgi:hypothetical protein
VKGKHNNPVDNYHQSFAKGAIEITSNDKESWQDGFEYILRKGTNDVNY